MANLDSQIFKDRLRNELTANYIDFNRFNQILIDTHSLIAGGSVLAAYHQGLKIKDFDIYIHPTDLCTLRDRLLELQFTLLDNKFYISPAYDQSFFRRNNILGRIQFVKDGIKPTILDVIIVKNSVPLTDVVQNFDLTFCEIWYDGNTVNAADPNGVLNKTGTLKTDYVNCLLEKFNTFTIKRINKYLKKGFNISYTPENRVYNINKNKTVTNPEEWVVYKIYDYIINNLGIILRERGLGSESYMELFFDVICNCDLEIHTLENLENMLKDCLRIPEDELRRIYIEILYELGYFYLPRTYKRYIENILNITEDDIYDAPPAQPVPRPNAQPVLRQNAQPVLRQNAQPVPRRLIFDSEPESDFETESEFASESESEPEPEYQEAMERFMETHVPVVFEEADDVDERNVTNTTCSDLYTLEDDKNIIEHLNEEDTFLFINRGSTNDFDILCFQKSYIQNIIRDINNTWFYECTGQYSRFIDVPYIKIPIDNTGLNGFIPLSQLVTLLSRNNRIYYIYPLLENGVQKMIPLTATWQNSYGPIENRRYVSANHCQDGSNILIYTLKLCTNPERCIRSIVQ
jgi:hypothetical protein